MRYKKTKETKMADERKKEEIIDNLLRNEEKVVRHLLYSEKYLAKLREIAKEYTVDGSKPSLDAHLEIWHEIRLQQGVIVGIKGSLEYLGWEFNEKYNEWVKDVNR
tara:strand:+ start:875 stop:1192 length:318 start_codon:yes stop_codon:yes gene_type:complete